MEILLGIVFTKFIVYFDEEINTFGYVVDFLLPRKFKLISENFKIGQPTKGNHSRCQTNGEECWRCRPGECEVEVQSGRF